MPVDYEMVKMLDERFANHQEFMVDSLNTFKGDVRKDIGELRKKIDDHIAEDSKNRIACRNDIDEFEKKTDEKISSITSKLVTISTIAASISLAIGLIIGWFVDIKKILS